MIDRIRQLGARTIATAIFGLFLLVVLSFAVGQCQKRRSEAAQGRVERGQAGAASDSAKDAIATVTRSGARESASEELTRSNEQEIRNAPGANDPVNPAARDAGLQALCRRSAYRDSLRCKELVR